MTSASLEERGRVAVIRFSYPPVNTLAHAMRSAVHEKLRRALADDSVRAVVLAGEGRGFCAGAEITEFNTPAITASPTAHEIWAAIEGASKPVVAAIHGLAMGGGLEFAMACHYRVAAPDARLALPEVRLGLLPGAGGTQRLPRAVGVARAIDMITSGEPVRAGELAGTLLVDRLAPGDVVEEAVLFAAQWIERRGQLRRLRDLDSPVQAPEEFFAEARRRVAERFRGYRAPLAIIDCIEAAAMLSFDEGIRVERSKFQELVNGSESKALRRAFFGERRVSKIEDFPERGRAIGEHLFARCREQAAVLRAQGVAPAQIERSLEHWGMARRVFAGAAAGAAPARAQKNFGDEEIIERCVFAMANEGARVLEAGLAERAVDVDVACLAGGFPRFRGGPLFHANAVGLKAVVAALSRYRDETGDEALAPAPLLAKMAAEGRLFD